jgi:hypothetical protein
MTRNWDRRIAPIQTAKAARSCEKRKRQLASGNQFHPRSPHECSYLDSSERFEYGAVLHGWKGISSRRIEV